MPIPIRKYVNITSFVGGQAIAGERSLSGLLISTAGNLEDGKIFQASSAREVGAQFGFDSREYLISQDYFGFIGKNGGRANKISFVKWSQETIQAQFKGAERFDGAENWQAMQGSVKFTIDGQDFTTRDLDFSSVQNLSDVAGVLRTAFSSGMGEMTGAQVSVKSNDDGSNNFIIYLPSSFSAKTLTCEPTQDDILDVGIMAGWAKNQYDEGKYIPSQNATDFTTFINGVFDMTNDFGSLAFVEEQPLGLCIEVAQVVSNLQNISFMLCLRVPKDDTDGWAQALQSFSGVAGTVISPENKNSYAELLPMFIMATTDYTKENSVVNYMYTLSDYPAEVTSQKEADKYDALRLNYVGQTQQAGRNVAFYQDGVLFGDTQKPTDMNTFANEMWFSDAMGVALFNALVAYARIPANEQGRGIVRTIAQGVIERAILNGTISQKSTLTDLQRVYVMQISNSEDAVFSVENDGYWITINIQDYQTEAGNNNEIANAVVNRKKIVYTLIYKKDDGISKIDGTHILI